MHAQCLAILGVLCEIVVQNLALWLADSLQQIRMVRPLKQAVQKTN